MVTFLFLFPIFAFAQNGYPQLPSFGCPSKGMFNKDQFALFTANAEVEIYRGGVPNEKGIQCLKSLGIDSVVDLQSEFETSKLNEQELLRSLSIRYFPFPMGTHHEYSPSAQCKAANLPVYQCDLYAVEHTLQVLKQEKDQHPRKIFIHCARGQDRTGLVLGIYRMNQGWSSSDAYREMREYWYTPYPALKEAWEAYLSSHP